MATKTITLELRQQVVPCENPMAWELAMVTLMQAAKALPDACVSQPDLNTGMNLSTLSPVGRS